jgi:lysophospholipase L1-like esterase
MRAVKPFLRVLAVNLGLLLAVAAVAELVFGNWFRDNYGTLVIPRDVDRRFDVKALYGGTSVRFSRDIYGLRGEYADPSRIDILAIGGSTTNEIFIDDAETWTATLGKALSETGKPVTVVNAGVDGQSTLGHLKNFELWFPRVPGLKARYVLAYVGINDMALALSGRPNKQDHLEAQRRPFKQMLINNSAVYGLYRTVKGILKARAANLIHTEKGYNGTRWTEPETQPDLAGAEARLKEHLDAYAGRLRELVRRIRAMGAEAIVVDQAMASYRLRDGKVLGAPRPDGTVDLGGYEDLAAFNGLAMRTCREVGAVCVDLAGELFFEDGDHYDRLHTTPAGSAKVGRYLADRLRPLFPGM